MYYMATRHPDAETYTIKAGKFSFTVQKSVSKTYGKNDAQFEYLKIGGDDMCVEYKFPKHPNNNQGVKQSRAEPVELQWLHTAGQRCVNNSDIEINKENTVFLFNVSIQVLKKYIPDVHFIEFLDNSHFFCKIPKQELAKQLTQKTQQQKTKMFLPHYYFLFHEGKTWYDAKFGAYPADPTQRSIYQAFPGNFVNPDKKPKSFDFMNDDLNEMFQPIWAKTKTWKEFIDKIRTVPEICAKTYPWYLRASNIIRENQMLPEKWMIDVSTISPIETIGGSRKTKEGTPKKMVEYIYDISVCHDYPNAIECRTIKYTPKN